MFILMIQHPAVTSLGSYGDKATSPTDSRAYYLWTV